METIARTFKNELNQLKMSEHDMYVLQNSKLINMGINRVLKY